MSEDWFEVYDIVSSFFAFCETRHYENTTVSLIIGPEKAALIDTGCGIGNLRKAGRRFSVLNPTDESITSGLPVIGVATGLS